MDKAKMMVNMAWAIAELNETTITRMDLQRHHITPAWYYSLDVWYGDGKMITIREDCTIVDRATDKT